MSTTRRENYAFPRIFKGRRDRTGHPKTRGALPAVGTLAPGNLISGCQAVKKKRELFPGVSPTSPSSFALPQR